MLARCLLANIIVLITCVNLFAQVFHHKTGQVIPTDKVDTVLWKPGVYNGYPANFGTLIVYEVGKPNGKKLTIPVIHILASDTSKNRTTVFVLNGGPGESNLRSELLFDALLNQFDVVLMGYRGVDGSTVLNCEQFKQTLRNDTLDSNNAGVLLGDAYNRCTESWIQEGIAIEGYTMDYVVRDIEMLRRNLACDKIGIFSYSYGTMIAQLYNNKFADNVNAMVMMGARPLRDFNFSAMNISYQLKLMGDSLLSDSSFQTMVLDFITNEENIGHNTIERSLFVFGNLYSIEGINKLYRALVLYNKGDISVLSNAYSVFEKNFPGDMVVGDMLIKKQGRLANRDTIMNSTDLDLLVQSLNYWYSYTDPQFDAVNDSIRTDSLPVLFVNNEFDIAAPPFLVEEALCSKFLNARNIIISRTGHLDLFFDTQLQDSINKVVLEFFQDQE